MASLSDILTATKNIVTALNQLGQTYLQVQGLNVYSNITTPTVIKNGQGRVVRVSVIVAGSADGAIYDADVATVTTDKLITIEKVIGIVEVNMPVNNGIVVHPGTGQTVTISYS
jgi:hypothetical protein